MTQDFLFGAILLAVAAVLVFIGLPNKSGASPAFLRFEAALVLYPPLIMVFVAGGAAELISGFLRMP